MRPAELGGFIAATGARLVVLYQESIAAPELTMCSIEWFANDVAPQLTSGWLGGTRPVFRRLR